MSVGLRGGLGQKTSSAYPRSPPLLRVLSNVGDIDSSMIVQAKENKMELDEILRKLQGHDLLHRNIKAERLKIDQEGKGLAKISISAERVDPEDGTTERIFYTENSLLSCGHVDQVFSMCQCGSSYSFCKACSSLYVCCVCHLPLCDQCRATSLFYNRKRYHKKCRWRFILNSLVGFAK